MSALTTAAALLVPFLAIVAVGSTLTLAYDALERWWRQ